MRESVTGPGPQLNVISGHGEQDVLVSEPGHSVM